MKHLLILAFALAGCVSSHGPQPLAMSHPANPDAAQAPYVREHNELLAITNLVTSAKPAETAEQHKHEHHQ
jgi:hypothetical protein